jgi:hypothetical protein
VERKRISASTIRSVGYDADQQALEIEFSSGSIVQYSGVSPEVHHRFVNSPSPGSFFQDQIDENFPYKRIGYDFTRRCGGRKGIRGGFASI